MKLKLVHKNGKISLDVTIVKDHEGKIMFDGIPAFMEKELFIYK